MYVVYLYIFFYIPHFLHFNGLFYASLNPSPKKPCRWLDIRHSIRLALDVGRFHVVGADKVIEVVDDNDGVEVKFA